MTEGERRAAYLTAEQEAGAWEHGIENVSEYLGRKLPEDHNRLLEDEGLRPLPGDK